MIFADMFGIGAATLFGIGVGARAFGPIIMPALGKLGSAGWSVSKFAAKNIAKSMLIEGASTLPWAASSVAKMSWGIGKFAIRHPYMTLGAVGAGAYLTTQTSPYESPSLSGVRMTSKFNEEQLAAQALQESGVAPMGGIVSGAAIRNQRMTESTQGLTFGLHRSRH